MKSILLAAAFFTSAAFAQQSGLTAETWTGLTPGKSPLILRKEGISTRAPNSIQLVSEAKVTGIPASAGTRLRGTLTPLVDDTYTFWVNGADNVALWLSEDGTRFTKRLIASHLGSTTTTEWNKHRDQRSIPIALTAGTTYHIEAHVMSSVAGGHLSLAWQGRKGNWALASNGATATQSTTQWDAHASRAIDGNTSGIWGNGEPTLTTSVQNSWLKVNFAATRPLNQIVLFNNSQDQLRLSNFRLSALDSSGSVLAQADFFTSSGNVGNSFTWDLPSVVQAAAIKIQLLGNNRAGNGFLSLAEIQAFHVTPPPTNWALASNGSTATQSSTSGTATASRIIDGNTNGDFNSNSVSLTLDQSNSWLEVDLGQDRSVNRVCLYNRNSLQTRLSNFRISLLDSANNILATRDYFTSSGNAATSHYYNLVNSVQARKIRVELLGNNLDANGYLSLAELQAFEINPLLETRDFQVIPAAYLGAASPDPADLNDNNLADVWEQQTGLASSSLPGALLEFGDPDKDGITNYDEFRYGSDPLVIEELSGGVTRAMWMDETSANVASFVRNRARFHSYPNDLRVVEGIDSTPSYKNYGARYRGSFIAPVSGEYRFWLSANGDAELWLSDGTVLHPSTQQPLTNRFGKQRIATSSGVTPLRDFDFNASQRSRVFTLTEGQSYSIEVLHKQPQAALEHVSIAWQAPGQPRAIIPSAVFLANAPEPLDLDDDNLPDAWETTKGLNPSNNGISSAADGEYGDPDADGVTNLIEFQNNTNPFAVDSDGDGASDYDEIFLYRSNPTVSNILAPVSLSVPALNQYTQATGAWTTNANGSLSAIDYRGSVTYSFTVSQPGVHEVVLSASVISPTAWLTSTFPVELSLNGNRLTRNTLSSRYGSADTVRAITPWLQAGTHTITVHHDNYSATLRLNIVSLALKRLGGLDLNANSIPDWIEQNEGLENAITQIPSNSLTSPASIEGMTRLLSSTSLSALHPGSTQAPPITTTQSINNSFFADVPLSADGAVTLNASFLGGVVTSTHSISWIPTNLLDAFPANTLHIRQGDSLRLTAHAPAESASGTFTISGTHAALPLTNQSSATPQILTFNTSGTQTLTATWTPVSGPTQTATVTLVVHSANFGPSHIVRVGTPRSWTPLSLGANAIVQADDRIVFTETTTNGARNFYVASAEAVNRHVIARLPGDVVGAPSAILARGTVHSYDVARVDRTRDAHVVQQYADGSWLMRSSLVAVNLPPNVIIRITATNQGTLFTNGSNILDLRSTDFDANGIADIFWEWTGAGTPKMCHSTQYLIIP